MVKKTWNQMTKIWIMKIEFYEPNEFYEFFDTNLCTSVESSSLRVK